MKQPLTKDQLKEHGEEIYWVFMNSCGKFSLN